MIFLGLFEALLNGELQFLEFANLEVVSSKDNGVLHRLRWCCFFHTTGTPLYTSMQDIPKNHYNRVVGVVKRI